MYDLFNHIFAFMWGEPMFLDITVFQTVARGSVVGSRHYATVRKVAGSIPVVAIGFFS
jgi:hypothetical protein